MSHVGYLVVGWGLTALVLGVYGASLMLRGRRLSGRVPAERRRWMTTSELDDDR